MLFTLVRLMQWYVLSLYLLSLFDPALSSQTYATALPSYICSSSAATDIRSRIGMWNHDRQRVHRQVAQRTGRLENTNRARDAQFRRLQACVGW